MFVLTIALMLSCAIAREFEEDYTSDPSQSPHHISHPAHSSEDTNSSGGLKLIWQIVLLSGNTSITSIDGMPESTDSERSVRGDYE